MQEQVLRNARIVLENEVIKGSLSMVDGLIHGFAEGNVPHGEDFEGDYLLPGLVELHTDHFESHYKPRPGVRWNPAAALQSHDAQIAGAGITTVFDAVRVGSDPESGDMSEDVAAQVGAIDAASGGDRLRAQHFVHLRCELPSRDCYDHFAAHCTRDVVRLASVMDHTPGARQFTLEQFIAYYQQRLRLNDAEMRRFIDDRRADQRSYAGANREAILARGREVGLSFASHDDSTAAHIEEALLDGVAIAEFPTTMEAAKAAHQGGLAVLMGAPNLVRGRSHSGNISAAALAREGVLDVLSSDYVPYALMLAAFTLPERVEGIDLPRALATVTRNPATAAGLGDRGAVAEGMRADLVRVQVVDGLPVVRSVWRQGSRVS
jgi:alpha-D-ribose 1-methylphosphonate 5-triphosphate diphosphatase